MSVRFGGATRRGRVWRLPALLVVALSILSTGRLTAQTTEVWRSWNQPVEPFRIIGNIYYVGANEITAFLIASDSGHVLLDGGFPETAPLILRSVEQLGFRPQDIKILLNSHAHFDHAGGLAALRRRTGARLLASSADADLLASGGAEDKLLADSGRFPPVPVDRRLEDGDVVRLGPLVLTAHLTPGHTPGCTTWSATVPDEGRAYGVAFVCSTTILPGVRLTGPEALYPGIAQDYRRTFAVLDSLSPDVFLAAHGSFFRLERKRETLAQSRSPNPFVDPEGYRAYVERGRRRFLDRLAEERAAP